jgi:hypothetical protein
MVQRYLVPILIGPLLVGAGCGSDTLPPVDDGQVDDGPVDEGPVDEGGIDDGAIDDEGSDPDPDNVVIPMLAGEIAVEGTPVQRPVPGRWPLAAFDGTQYLVVWVDYRARRPVLYGGRIAIDGTALDPLGFPILDPGGVILDESKSALAFDGTNFLVVLPIDGEIRGVRVSAAGDVLDPGGIVIAEEVSSFAAWPSLAFDGNHYWVAWSKGAWPLAPDNGIYWARVTPEGSVLEPGGVLAHPLNVEATRVGVSFDGSNTLLSWGDFDDELQDTVVDAARIAPDGTLLDQAPIRISPIGVGVEKRIGPVAGFDGTNHVIAWSDLGPDAEGHEEYRILASRVTPEGTLLDPEAIWLSTENIEADDVHRVDVASGNGRSVVTWSLDYGGEGGPASWHVGVAQIATDGTASVLPKNTFPRGLEATVATRQDGALLLWREGEELNDDYPAITGMRLDASAMPVAADVVAPAWPASRQEVMAAASDGQVFFVLWTDTRDPTGEGRALYGGRIASDGTPLDLEPIQLSTYRTDLADVVFDGANFVVTWVRFSDGEGNGNPFETVRVSPAGERLDVTPLEPPLSSYDRTLDGASDGTHTLLVGNANDAESVLAAVVLDQEGAPASNVIHIVDKNQGSAYQPSVSFDGVGYLVVWRDDSSGIFGQRISTAGELEGQRFSIDDGPAHHVGVAAGGGIHMVVWQSPEGIWATRVSPNGQVLDPEAQLVAVPELGYGDCSDSVWGTGNCAAVAFDGEKFVVAWRSSPFPTDWTWVDLYGAVLSVEGEVSEEFPISQEPESEGQPVLASGDGRVLAAYTRFVPGAPYDTRRAMARLLFP